MMMLPFVTSPLQKKRRKKKKKKKSLEFLIL